MIKGLPGKLPLLPRVLKYLRFLRLTFEPRVEFHGVEHKLWNSIGVIIGF